MTQHMFVEDFWKMRVCLIGPIADTLPNSKGGVASVVKSLATELTRKGLEVHVVTEQHSGNSHQYIENTKFQIHRFRSSILPGFLSYSLVDSYKIRSMISKINPDLVHFHGIAGYSFNCQYPFILTIHGVNERDALFDGRPFGKLRSKIIAIQERHFRKLCNNVVLINPYISDLLSGQIVGRTWHINNPVERDFFSAVNFPTRKVFYAGMISPRKNVLGILRAFERVVRHISDAKLSIAGPATVSDYDTQCREFVAKNKLTPNIEFLGPVSSTRIKNELGCSSCTVLFSKQETAPVILAESMAAGVPVVAAKVGGTGSMIRDGATGFLVPQDDEAELATKLSLLLGDTTLQKVLGHNAKRFAEQNFSQSKIADLTIEAYLEVLGKV